MTKRIERFSNIGSRRVPGMFLEADKNRNDSIEIFRWMQTSYLQKWVAPNPDRKSQVFVQPLVFWMPENLGLVCLARSTFDRGLRVRLGSGDKERPHSTFQPPQPSSGGNHPAARSTLSPVRRYIVQIFPLRRFSVTILDREDYIATGSTFQPLQPPSSGTFRCPIHSDRSRRLHSCSDTVGLSVRFRPLRPRSFLQTGVVKADAVL
jgi:hypothetical protein